MIKKLNFLISYYRHISLQTRRERRVAVFKLLISIRELNMQNK